MRSLLCLIALVSLMGRAGACELASVLVQRFGISAANEDMPAP